MSQKAGTQTFNRWKPPGEMTLAYRLFQRDLTELNDFTWHAQGATNNVLAAIAKGAAQDEIQQYVNYGKDLGRRKDTRVDMAKRNIRYSENWIRLLTLIQIASAFELFVRRMVVLTVQSDPGSLIATPRAVDGVTLLKRGTLPDTAATVGHCAEGLWSKRAHHLGRLYQATISEVDSNISELQGIQDLRNSVAHEFGRKSKRKDFWYVDPELAEAAPLQRVSADRLQTLMRIVSVAAAALDRRAAGHIGAFELMLFWHHFEQERAASKNAVIKRYIDLYRTGGSAKLISSYYHNVIGGTLGRDYCHALLDHYSGS